MPELEDEPLDVSSSEDSLQDVLTDPDVLASIMQQLGLRLANLNAAVHRVASRLAVRAGGAARAAPVALARLGQRGARPVPLARASSCCRVASFASPTRIITGRRYSAARRGARRDRPRPGAGAGEFQQPTGSRAMAATSMWPTLATAAHKISLFDAKPIATVGSFGEAPGQLHAPVGLALHEGTGADGVGSFLFCADCATTASPSSPPSPSCASSAPLVLTARDRASWDRPRPASTSPPPTRLLFVADRANHRLQVFATDGSLLRVIGQRGTAPGSFRRIRGIAVGGRAYTQPSVSAYRLSPMDAARRRPPGTSSASRPTRATSAPTPDPPEGAVLSFLQGEGRAASARRDVASRTCLPSSPTAACDSDHLSIVGLSKRLIPQGPRRARRRRCARAHAVSYTLRDKSERASETLEAREGMCTNKANLQVALLRVAGIPAGYVLCHISKEAFAGPTMLDEVHELIQPTTVHVFCAVYIPFVAPPSGAAAEDYALWVVARAGAAATTRSWASSDTMTRPSGRARATSPVRAVPTRLATGRGGCGALLRQATSTTCSRRAARSRPSCSGSRATAARRGAAGVASVAVYMASFTVCTFLSNISSRLGKSRPVGRRRRRARLIGGSPNKTSRYLMDEQYSKPCTVRRVHPRAQAHARVGRRYELAALSQARTIGEIGEECMSRIKRCNRSASSTRPTW